MSQFGKCIPKSKQWQEIDTVEWPVSTGDLRGYLNITTILETTHWTNVTLETVLCCCDFIQQHTHIYIYSFSRCFYPKRLTVHSTYTFFVHMCVPWELNPQPFVLLTQCSTTEPKATEPHTLSCTTETHKRTHTHTRTHARTHTWHWWKLHV